MSELFLTIFNTAMTAGWLVLAVLVARVLLKNAPSWAKCALWAIVGVRLVWPFELESILSLVPSAQTLPPAELTAPAPQIHTGIHMMNSAINPSFTQTFAPAPEASVNPLQIVVMIAAVLWVIGMVAMAAYAAVSYLRLRRRVAVSIPAGEGVYLCDAISSPFILGLIRPKIFLPSELPREQWDAILSHERAHLARRDHWWKPLGYFLLMVFWFHPLLWVAYILLCRDVEVACDEKVIKALTPEEKQAYSQILLQCSMPRKWITVCPLAFGEVGVKERVKNVLNYKKPTLWIIIAALIVCSVLAVCFLTDPVNDQAVMLFDRDLPDAALQGEVELDGFRDVSVRWSLTPNLITSEEKPVLVKDGKESTLFGDYPPPRSLYVADVTGDGKPDLCADVYYFFSGLPSFNAVCVYDIVNDCYHMLADAEYTNHYTKVGYYLRLEQGRLLCDMVLEHDDSVLCTGTMYLTEDGQLRLKALEGQGGTAIPQAVGHYAEDDDNWSWNFGLSVMQDGRFSYSEGMVSSYIGFGDWEMKNGKLYLTEGQRCFVFEVRADGLAYIAGESDRGLSLKDGQLLLRSQMQKQLTFVEVTDIQKDHFLAVDVKGNNWRIEHPCEALDFDLQKCWVTYFGQPEIDEEGRYLIRAASCWLYREGTGDAGTIFDSYIFDVDGDGTAEYCYLTSQRTPSSAYVSRLDTMVYKLIVTEADGITYEAAFLELLIPDENAFGAGISPDVDTSQYLRVYAYAEAFAFAVEDGELLIVAPRGGKYIETGMLTTYQITIVDSKLIVKEQ